jgi:arylformamidase
MDAPDMITETDTLDPVPVKVWRDLTQAELDNAYDQAKYAPNMQQVLARFASNSEVARSRLGNPGRFSYGPSAVETFDLYSAGRSAAVVVVYVHGGAWRVGAAKNHAYAAELFVRAGCHFAVLDFVNVIDAGGNLTVMADQVRRAVTWIYDNAETFAADRRHIFLCGHSSGAHLGAVLLTTEWKRFNLPQDIFKAALLTSGIYDLEAPRLSTRNTYVNFTDAIERDLSPQRHVSHLNCPLILAYGSQESPEFQRQSREFAAAVEARRKPIRLIRAEGYNHFEIAETLANPYGVLGRAMLELLPTTKNGGA